MQLWLQSNQRTLIFAVPLLIICFLLFNPFKSASTEIPSPLTPLPENSSIEEEPIIIQPESLKVDIKGMVRSPGVYLVNEGDRVIDLLKLAGGEIENADINQVNLSQKLQDEMVVYIPEVGEEVSSFSLDLTQTSTSSEGKININTADSTMLQTIPGVGPAKAQAIIDYREINGNFTSIEDIKNISGIGDKTFDKLKESIDVK